jgi:hypothetical protein
VLPGNTLEAKLVFQAIEELGAEPAAAVTAEDRHGLDLSDPRTRDPRVVGP